MSCRKSRSEYTALCKLRIGHTGHILDAKLFLHIRIVPLHALFAKILVHPKQKVPTFQI